MLPYFVCKCYNFRIVDATISSLSSLGLEVLDSDLFPIRELRRISRTSGRVYNVDPFFFALYYNTTDTY